MKIDKEYIGIVILNLLLSMLIVYYNPRFDIITLLYFVVLNAFLLLMLKLKKYREKQLVQDKIEKIFELLHSLDIDTDNYEIVDDEFGKLRDEILKIIIESKVVAKRATDNQQVLREYTEDIAHQIKTPLTGALLMLDLIEEDGIDSGQYIGYIRNSMGRLEQLADILLKMAALDSETIDMKKEPISIIALLEDIKLDMEAYFIKDGVDIPVCGDDFILTCDKRWTYEAIFNIVKNGIEAYLWFKNPRDTYTLTKEILNDFDVDYKVAENTGRLYFNKDILEYKMIYPSGIIPPKRVLVEAIETYGACLLLALLFAVMIYGAFNVWNNRDIKELALLKSVGMTEKQVGKMVRLKSLHLSFFPIIIGTIISYLTSNLLLYLVWLNNSITYSKLSNIFGERMQTYDFHPISVSVPTIILIILLSFITVYISALLPARQSAKLKVIEGLNGISEKKAKFGKSKISGKIENSLARDYFRSYRSTYRTITLSMVVYAMVVTFMLVSQSYRTLTEKYDNYHSSYNFTSHIYTESNLDKSLIDDLNKVDGIDELHIYENKDFKFFLKDNNGFLSNEFEYAINKGKKHEDKLYASIYGLSDEDYQQMLEENGLTSTTSYVMLNKISDDDTTPYAFRNYIPIAKEEGKVINIKYNAKGKTMQVPIGGYINKIPYDLDGYGKNGIYIFTRMSTLESFIEENGNDGSDPTNYYKIKIKAKYDLGVVADKCEKIILSYIPKSDHSTTTDILKKAANEEQTRNEHLLNAGIQIILLIIGLSNAYNSFHGNLRSRRREFQLLSTVGMTEKQMKKMFFSESKILFGETFIAYILVFGLAIAARTYRSNFDFGFAVKELMLNLNYIPIILIFAVMAVGILLAIRSSIKSILGEDLNSAIREI